MPTLILFNKPFKVLSQFSPEKPQGELRQFESAQDDPVPPLDKKTAKETLARFIKQKSVYPAGRLDYDSEGLILLTDDGALQHHIAHPDHKQPKTYWVQVEGGPSLQAIEQLRHGVTLKDGVTQPALVEYIPEPTLWQRTPPVRFRQSIPTHWLSITISEGRNRQVRRMTAAVGLPTLRLIRTRIGDWQLDGLLPGEYKTFTVPPMPLSKAQSNRTPVDRQCKRSYSQQSRKPVTASTRKKPTE
ncbi:MAG: 23S rRNA pseudouridine2457 synthase [Candidatus Endobugula sp.]|jgi:23S rRNA pseudouridine2457 synthase